MVEPQEPTSQALILALAAYILPQALHSPPLCSLDTLSLEISREETPPAKERGRWEPKTKLPPNRSDKHVEPSEDQCPVFFSNFTLGKMTTSHVKKKKQKNIKQNQGELSREGSSPVKPAWLSPGLALLNPSFKGPESRQLRVLANPTAHGCYRADVSPWCWGSQPGPINCATQA